MFGQNLGSLLSVLVIGFICIIIILLIFCWHGKLCSSAFFYNVANEDVESQEHVVQHSKPIIREPHPGIESQENNLINQRRQDFDLYLCNPDAKRPENDYPPTYDEALRQDRNVLHKY